ncbi:MAG: DUF4859 domain-containing protein [Bacteroidaceae bacterium]|nr:DUF4859 domain-containing protein [Bacteroidaceae bacterium]
MRKIYSLLVAMVIAIAANAQVIQFAEADIADAGAVNGKVFTNGNFSLSVFDEAGKVAIDANNVYYGDATEQVKFTHRLKSGGKSSLSEGKTNYMTLSVPSDGKIKIYARTGSNSATDRNVVLTQNDTELLNKILLESEAIKVMMGEEEKSVYPAVEADVKAGTVTVTYPVGSINFYAFEFVAAAAPAPSVDADFTATLTQYPTSDYSASYAVFSLAEVAKTLGTDAATLAGALESGAAYAGLVKPLELTEGHTLLVDDLVAAGALQDDVVRFYITNASGASREGWGIGGFANSDNWSPKEEWNGVAGESWVYEYPVSKILEVAGTEPGEWHGVGITINIYNDCKVSKVELVQTQTTADGPGSFWLTSAGERTSWGNNSVIYNSVLGIDADADELAIPVGQFPDAMAGGESTSFVLSVVYGEKIATLGVTLNVVARPEIAAPASKYSELEIVKSYDLPLEFYTGKSYEGKTVKFTLDGIYDALGIDANTLDLNIGSVLLTRTVNAVTTGEEDNAVTTYSMSDVLSTPEAAAGGGWFGRYSNYDEATGNDEYIAQSLPMGWATGDNTIYVQEASLVDGEFSFVTGQYPGKLYETGDFVELYIVNGTKAVKLNMPISVVAEPVVSFDEWVKVGEDEVEIKHILGGSGAAFTLDLDKVAELLGCDKGDVAFNILAGEGALSNDHTATKGGCWMTKEGYSIAWGVAGYAIYVEPDVNMTFTDFSVGFNDAAWTLGDVEYIKLLFNFAGKYYQKTLKVMIVEKEISGVDPDSNFDIVSTVGIVQQIVPSGAYYGNEEADIQAKMQYDLGIDKIKEILGEGTYKVYGQDAPATADSYPTISAAYTYGANTGFDVGFWMAEPVAELGEKYAEFAYTGSWPDCPFGIEFAYNTGIIGFDQIPNRKAVGDTYKSIFYWVNTDNNKAIKIVVTVKYVEEYTERETGLAPTVESLAFAVTDDNFDNATGVYNFMLDTTKLYEALGLTDETITDAKIIAPTSEFDYGVSYSFDEMLMYSANGYAIDDETRMNVLAGLTIVDGKLALAMDPVELTFEDGTDDKATVRIGLAYDGKYFLYVINLGNNITGINAVAADKASVKKVVRDGSVVIVKNGQEFNVTGARIK